MLSLPRISPDDWRRLVVIEKLAEDIPDYSLKSLELDPCHKMPLHKWAALGCQSERCIGEHSYHDRQLPPEPTDTEPGSDEKINIMAARMLSGYDPFHPEDMRWEDVKHLRRALLPKKSLNGHNMCQPSSAEETCQGVQPCVSIVS